MRISHKTLVILLSFLAASTSVRGDCKNLSWRTRSHLDSLMGIQIPNDYCYIKGIGVYKLHEDPKNWSVARQICNDEGAHLAILNSRKEAESLRDMFRNSSLKNNKHYEGDVVFMGFHDLYQEGQFVTIFDESLVKAGYNTWSTMYGGQPDNAEAQAGTEDIPANCGGLLHDASLDDVACSWKLGFICEIPTGPSVLSEISKSFDEVNETQFSALRSISKS